MTMWFDFNVNLYQINNEFKFWKQFDKIENQNLVKLYQCLFPHQIKDHVTYSAADSFFDIPIAVYNFMYNFRIVSKNVRL